MKIRETQVIKELEDVLYNRGIGWNEVIVQFEDDDENTGRCLRYDEFRELNVEAVMVYWKVYLQSDFWRLYSNENDEGHKLLKEMPL